MTQLPKGKTRLDLIREGLVEGGFKKRGRLVVSLDRLIEDPANERKTFHGMESLIASIKSVGLVEPITVTPQGSEGENYQIVTGHRRYRAAKAAGLLQVEVLIREPEDEKMRRLKSIVSNVQREDVGPVEMAEALQSLLDDNQVTSQRQLALAIGKDETWVSRMLRILSLPTRLKTKLASTQVSIGYDAAASVARLEKEADQTELIDALLAGASQDEIRDRIREKRGLPAKPMNVDSTADSASPKPKRVYYTKYKAVVIIQAETEKLSNDQVIDALQEALGRALNGSSTTA
jgi:ParB family chromosome partitioning protein